MYIDFSELVGMHSLGNIQEQLNCVAGLENAAKLSWCTNAHTSTLMISYISASRQALSLLLCS